MNIDIFALYKIYNWLDNLDFQILNLLQIIIIIYLFNIISLTLSQGEFGKY